MPSRCRGHSGFSPWGGRLSEGGRCTQAKTHGASSCVRAFDVRTLGRARAGVWTGPGGGQRSLSCNQHDICICTGHCVLGVGSPVAPNIRRVPSLPSPPPPEDVSGAGGVLGRGTVAAPSCSAVRPADPLAFPIGAPGVSPAQPPCCRLPSLLGHASRHPGCTLPAVAEEGRQAQSRTPTRPPPLPSPRVTARVEGVCTCAELPLLPGLPAASPCLFLQGGPRCPPLLLAHPSVCLLCYYSGWQGQCQPGLLGAKPPGPKQ